jgi:DNA invertase Pin-like site-specific DNA recombinase
MCPRAPRGPPVSLCVPRGLCRPLQGGRERQLEGIAKAKAAGVYQGRKPSIDAEAVRKLRAEGKGATEIAKALGVGRASVYRLLSDSAA